MLGIRVLSELVVLRQLSSKCVMVNLKISFSKIFTPYPNGHLSNSHIVMLKKSARESDRSMESIYIIRFCRSLPMVSSIEYFDAGLQICTFDSNPDHTQKFDIKDAEVR